MGSLRARLCVFCLVVFVFPGLLWCPAGHGAGLTYDLFHPPTPLTEAERGTLGVMGVARAYYLPRAELNAFARGKATGSAKGAAGGFVNAMAHMGRCSGDFCGLALVIWAATAGVVGAVHGALEGYEDALPAAEVKRAEDLLEKLSLNLKLQERMQEKFLQNAREKTTRKLIVLDRPGPSTAGEKVDYGILKGYPVDSVFEVRVESFGFETWPSQIKQPKTMAGSEDPPLSLFLSIRPRLIRLCDNQVLYQPRREIRSGFFRRSEWEADNFSMVLDKLDGLMGDVSDAISDDLFVTYVR